MVVKGVLIRRVGTAPLTSVSDLTYRQWPLGRVFNYATFTLRSVGLFHPLRRVRYLPSPNELYLRATEEAFDPAAVEERMGRSLDDRTYPRVALILAGAMGTEEWPLVRDTFAEVMKTQRIGVRGQLDGEARRVAAADSAERNQVRVDIASAWWRRLAQLYDTSKLSELDEFAETVGRCLPDAAQAWVEDRMPADDEGADPVVPEPSEPVPASKPRRYRDPGPLPRLAVAAAAGGLAATLGTVVGTGVLLGGSWTIVAVAGTLAAGGGLLGHASFYRGWAHVGRRILWWGAATCVATAWWIELRLLGIGLLELYALVFAALALVVGALEVRYRPDSGSWTTWGPPLAAAFLPSLAAVVATTAAQPARHIWLVLGGAAAVVLGVVRRRRAPVVLGAAAAALAAIHLLILALLWLLVPGGVELLTLR